LRARLPLDVQQKIALAKDWMAPTVEFDVDQLHGSVATLQDLGRRVAEREGPIAGVRGFVKGDDDIPLEALVVERALSVNTAAAGGNASLMTID
jgi:RHH-type proline utilization regulon transcriptional repressor/proline dehydrogenase/delta 1-pyrroline-5-carboxylate dehydrogenase